MGMETVRVERHELSESNLSIRTKVWIGEDWFEALVWEHEAGLVRVAVVGADWFKHSRVASFDTVAATMARSASIKALIQDKKEVVMAALAKMPRHVGAR